MLREWGDGNGNYAAILRVVPPNVLGSAVEVDWFVATHLVIVTTVFVSSCQADALCLSLIDFEKVAWAASAGWPNINVTLGKEAIICDAESVGAIVVTDHCLAAGTVVCRSEGVGGSRCSYGNCS